MYRLTIRISGDIEHEESVDLPESEVLPQFKRLKEILGLGEKAKKVWRRPTKAEASADTSPAEPVE